MRDYVAPIFEEYFAIETMACNSCIKYHYITWHSEGYAFASQ